MVLPLPAVGATIPAAAGAGFNPLSLLSGPIAGGIPGIGPSSATSGSYQDVFVNSPFNVGSGSLTSDADSQGAAMSRVAENLLPYGLLVVGAWVAIAALKK